MAIELAIFYTPMHFLWGVKSGATPVDLNEKCPWSPYFLPLRENISTLLYAKLSDVTRP